MTIELRRDGTVLLDSEIIGHIFGEPRNWGFMLADSRMPAKTPERGWHSKGEAADMCARAHQETPRKDQA